jgi:cell division protein FtsW (lipid II flippase)
MPAVMPTPLLAAAAVAAIMAAARLGETCRYIAALLGVLLLRGLALHHSFLHAVLPGAGLLLLLLAALLPLHLHAAPRFLALHSRRHVRLLSLAPGELSPHRLFGMAPALEHLPLAGPAGFA